MAPTILIAESSGFSKQGLLYLETAAQVVLADLDRDSLLSTVRNSDVLWVRLRHRIDREVFEAAPQLRAIATPTTGLNHIDLTEAESRNIQIISLRDEIDFLQGIYATAEYTMALIFSLFRHIPAAHDHAIEGHWNRDLFVGRELFGKIAGIIGYGRIGRMVGRYLRAFGMHVIVCDIREINPAQAEEGIERAPLIELLRNSDLITLHVPFTEKTRRLLGPHEFTNMKKGAWFINTSRGEIVDESALLRGLIENRIAGAALDVLCDERSSGMSENPVVQYAQSHGNVLITPHIAGCTFESREKTEIFLAGRVVSFLAQLHKHQRAISTAASPALL
jgi:D-3-phosphoglycerate dehydrogenase / 2-oxoglutarate reductase